MPQNKMTCRLFFSFYLEALIDMPVNMKTMCVCRGEGRYFYQDISQFLVFIVHLIEVCQLFTKRDAILPHLKRNKNIR